MMSAFQIAIGRAERYREEGLWRLAAGSFLDAAGLCEDRDLRAEVTRSAEAMLTRYQADQARVAALPTPTSDPRRI